MPLCREKKLTLSGEVQTFSCELVSLREGVGILRYVIDRDYDVAGYKLAPGDVTLALYWENRPYTLFIWYRTKQCDRAYYFNIADAVLLRPEEFSWRDLAVDILVDGAGNAHVLDEHELPPDLPPRLAGYIEEARDHVLAHFGDILKEAEELLETEHVKTKP